MIKHRITMKDSSYRESIEAPTKIERIQTMFVCGGVEHFTFADAQVYQVENSPKDEEGNITEWLPITESENTIETKELVW